MIVQLSLILVASLFNAIRSCSNGTIANGRLANYKVDSEEGDSASLVCSDGYTTYNSHLVCGQDNTWVPTPICHKVFVRFNKTSMIKYVYPTPYDSVNSSVSFSFSTPPLQSTGVLVRLTSKKLSDGSRDTLTVELVGGFLATTMQLSSIGQRIIGFCHDDMLLNDNMQHRVVLKRNPDSLSMTIDNRSIQCSYPSGSNLEFTFTALRSIQVGHLQPTWGEAYGFTGCMTDLFVDGLSPLILADLAENTKIEDQVSVQDVDFVETCGEKYNVPTTQPPQQPTNSPPLDTNPITGAVEDKEKDDDSGKDKTTLIVILVTIVILILLVLLIGIVCKKYYNNKGTYKVDESRLRADQENPEQEYFI